MYYLLIKFLSAVLIPRVASVIDSKERISVARLGLGLQFLGVLLSAISIYILHSFAGTNPTFEDETFLGIFTFMVFSGLLGTLGSSLMDISIANDVAPSLFSGHDLVQFNSHSRQVDLITEVGSPVIAGILLAFSTLSLPLTGFLIIVLWNLISFIPELLILHSVFNERADLKFKLLSSSNDIKKSFLQKLLDGWKSFLKQSVSPVIIASSLLWLSVLSPHGVLLTAFLNDGWKIPEWTIGIFRSSGAFFGLAATAVFPFALRFMNLRKASALFLTFQALMVLGAYLMLHLEIEIGQYSFLLLILFSRIGLYGFGLGEVQIRQEEVPQLVRGEVNGFANALNGISTLILFSLGTVLSSTKDFKYLVLFSVISVWVALLVYLRWMNKSELGP